MPPPRELCSIAARHFATDISDRPDLIEKLIGVFFFGQRLGQQRHDRTVPQLPREIAGRGVSGNLVMVHPLRRADQCKIGGSVFFLFALPP